MMPLRSQTGTPRHFHSSTTSGSACLISARTRASVSPRQSLSSSILASISWEGEASPAPCSELLFFMLAVTFFMIVSLHWPQMSVTSLRSHPLSGQSAGLFHPVGELGFIDLVILADVEVTHVFLLGSARRRRIEQGAAEEGHLDVFREAMDAEEPALPCDPIERRVPFDCLGDARHRAGDYHVEATPDLAFPARHRRNIGLHGRVAMTFGDLRVAARQKPRRGGRFGDRLACHLGRRLGSSFGHRVHSHLPRRLAASGSKNR
ncbi:hypothetical protein RHECNPAF_6420079 [Rhizobium etli CNPAF512]|nr:hypothetical protein RHECNPAF_6420079 [Rhizobium etli CNPAF512]